MTIPNFDIVLAFDDHGNVVSVANDPELCAEPFGVDLYCALRKGHTGLHRSVFKEMNDAPRWWYRRGWRG